MEIQKIKETKYMAVEKKFGEQRNEGEKYENR